MNIYNKIKRRISSNLIKKTTQLNLLKPTISFTFDDAPNSAFINGSAILKKYGYCGTYYVSLGLKELPNSDKNYFDYTHLIKAIEDGHELGCHTYSHISLYKSKKEDVIKDLSKNQEKINELIPNYKFKSFAYPYGEYTYNSLKVINDTFVSARTTRGGINYNKVNLLNLRAFELSNQSDINMLYAMIDKTIQSNGWLILNTHDVEENPSQWGCTPAYFESIVKYCYEKKIAVKKIAEVTEIIK